MEARQRSERRAVEQLDKHHQLQLFRKRRRMWEQQDENRSAVQDTAGCLFDLKSDPSEKVDLTVHGNSTHLAIFRGLLARFEQLKSEYHAAPVAANPPEEDAEVCGLAKSTGGFLRPWKGPGVPTVPPF